MGALSFIQSYLSANLGLKSVTASTGGGANARLGSLMPLVSGSTQAISTFPSLAGGISLSCPNNTYGTSNWTQLLSSGTLSAHSLMSVSYGVPATILEFELQIASGAAGAEVISARIHGHHANTLTIGKIYPLIPAIQWPTNERVAVRIAGDSTGPTVSVACNFMGRPI